VPVAAGAPAFAGGAVPAFPAAVGGGGAGFIIPGAVAAFVPLVAFGSDDDDSDTPDSARTGPIGPIGPIGPGWTPTEPVFPAASVPEPSLFLLLLAGLSGILVRKHLIK